MFVIRRDLDEPDELRAVARPTVIRVALADT